MPGADAGAGAPNAGAPGGAANLGGMSGTGAAGGGGLAGALSQGGSGASAGAQVGGGGSGGTAPIAGDAGEAGSPELVEFGRCGQRAHPLHCSSGQLDPDETDVDCGGPSCAPCAGDENCLSDHDCATGACVNGKCDRQLSLKYVQQAAAGETPSFRFNSVLAYTGQNPILLRDLSVRYYFSRNTVTEPILPSGSTMQLPDGGDISSATRWSIVRQLRGNGITNDAYLEISFTGGKILSDGDSLDMTTSTITGDGVSLFNQKTHFSYESDTALHESKKLAIYHKGQRIWGRGPVIDDPEECFHLGVNLDGPAVTVGNDAWLISPDSVLDRYIDLSIVLKPSTDKGREDMLRAGFFFHDNTFSYAVDNGSYALLVDVWSADGAETGTLKVQDQTLDTFQATSFAGGGPWVPLGPYRITVTNGQLKLAALGDLRVGGIELRLLDE